MYAHHCMIHSTRPSHFPIKNMNTFIFIALAMDTYNNNVGQAGESETLGYYVESPRVMER